MTEHPDDRLDSWKEIAAFLQRDVRTVQRWEKQAGLPVYRHAESRLRTAYAYRSELDRWWRGQRSDFVAPDPASAPAPQPSPADGIESSSSSLAAVAPDDPAAPVPVRLPAANAAPEMGSPSGTAAARARTRSMALALAALLIAGWSVGAWRWRGARPESISSVRPIGVVIAPFDGGSASPGVVAALNAGLDHGLAAQPLVDVMPPAARRVILRLMRRAAEEPLTVAIAREMCVRAGGYRLVVAGRLRKLGPTYLIGLDVIDPTDGRIRGSVEREVGAEDRVHDAIHAEAREIAALLARLPEPAAPAGPLERVTTASLDALRIYTQAVAAAHRRAWDASELLGRRAIAADDQFASAYALVGWAMRNRKRPAADCLKFAERAVALAPATTEREMYFISGTYYSLTGDLDKARAAYEALITLQPHDTRALDRLIDVYSRSGRVKEAVEHSVRRAADEPDDFYANVRAAHAMRIWHGDRALAEPFLRRSRTLASPETLQERPFWGAWLTLLPVFERWLADDPQAALATVGNVAGGLGSRLGRERDGFATVVGFSYLSMGRRREGESAFRYASAPTRQLDLAMLALLNDDRAAARGWLAQVPESSGDRPELFARAGLIDEAERGLAKYFDVEHGEGVADVTRGLIAIERGQQDRAIPLLRRGTERLRYSGEPAYFMGVDALARIWERHDATRALRLLTDAVRQRRRTYASPWWSGAFWIKANANLLVVDRRLGLTADAERVSATLRRALQFADDDHPIRVLLRAAPSPSRN